MVFLEYLQAKSFKLIHLIQPLVFCMSSIFINESHFLFKDFQKANDLFLKPFDLGHIGLFLGVHVELFIKTDWIVSSDFVLT